jgi:hypothetical protein
MTIDPHQLPHDLAPIAAAMDDLADRERRAAPLTLEDRLFMATRVAACGRAGAQDRARATPQAHRLRLASFSRLAAVVALAGAGIAVYLAQLPRHTAPPTLATITDVSNLEEDMDMMLAMRTLGEGPETTGQKIDELYLDAENVRSSLRGDWSRTLLDEGSM